MENILLPSQITYSDTDQPHHGRVVIMPLHQGYGTSVGNSLRRVLLSSLPGAAITALKVRGVSHEFTAIEGVKEDGVEILLNVKQLRLRVFSAEPVRLHLKTKGAGSVKAGDIDANSDVEIINKDLVLFNVTDAKAAVDIEFIAEQGRGFLPVEERDKRGLELGTIAVDAIFTPIVDVGYNVEFTRVGDITNYEKLTIDVETDGTMSPQEAIVASTKLLMDHFRLLEENLV